jgi:hypothetical protein
VATEWSPQAKKRQAQYLKRQERRWTKRNGPVEVRVDPSIVRPQKPPGGSAPR